MSTRVQKGGTVFRPVARPRTRPGTESRQVSAIPDTREPTGHRDIPDESPASLGTVSDMPDSSFTGAAYSNEVRTNTAMVRMTTSSIHENTEQSYDGNARESFMPARPSSARPPAVQVHLPASSSMSSRPSAPTAQSAISSQSREAARPIVIGQSRAAPAVVSVPRPRPPVSSSSIHEDSMTFAQPRQALAPSQNIIHPLRSVQQAPSHIDISQIDPSLILPSTTLPPQSFLHDETFPSHSSSGNAPQQGSETENGAHDPKLRRKASRVIDESGDADATNDDGPSSKSRRRRAKSALAATNGEDAATTRPYKRKRSRPTSGDGTQSEGNEGQNTPRRRKRASSTVSRRAQTRAPSSTPFDPHADPGEELDPTVITMSALCDDTGQGRVSSKAAQIVTNHVAWRAANKEKRARLKAIMEAKKYGRNTEDDDQLPGSTNAAASESGGTEGAARSLSNASGDVSEAGPSTPRDSRPGGGGEFDYAQDLATSRYNVQVRIGANGETIIDEESLFVNRNEEDDTENYTHIEESDTSKFVNSLTYSKKSRGSRWSAVETELFYDALSQFGENYELISYILPGRDRKACKNKFKAEDKKNPNRITYCLNNRRPLDIQTLSRMTGKDFSGPTPIIRAPTPLLSTQLDTNIQTETPESPNVVRKQSKTPGLEDDQEEILGTVDDEGSVFGDAI